VLEGDETTFQQKKHVPNKITKLVEEEWDQLNLRLADYTQNIDQRFLLKNLADLSELDIRLVRSIQKTSQNLSLSFHLWFLSNEIPK
jgi:hypothetical protein